MFYSSRSCEVNLIMKELDILNRLKDDFVGLVHPMYPFPAPYIGSGEIKAIILGADPTRILNNSPQPFRMVFELDNEMSPYWRGIGKNIELVDDLSMDNVYVQNLCRNYFTKETAKNQHWVRIAREYWIKQLNDELDSRFNPAIPVLITTEFILNACLVKVRKVKARDIYGECLSFPWKDNLFGRELLALYRHPAYSLQHWNEYSQFLSKRIKYLGSLKPFDALKIIAKRVDGAYLVRVDDENGFMVNDKQKVVSPIMMYDSFLARGYWLEANDNPDFDLKRLYVEAMKVTKDSWFDSYAS